MLVAAILLAPLAASAQSTAPSSEQIADLTARARAALPLAQIEDGSKVPPETPEELRKPIVSQAIEIAAIRRGELSAQMQLCGLDWQRESYLPFMRSLRAGGWRGKKMAYVGLLHGLSQGTTISQGTNDNQNCDDAKIAALKREAELLPSTSD